MRFFILFFALLFPLISSGQLSEVEVKSGEKVKNSSRKSFPEVFGYDGSGGMYAMQTRFKRSYGIFTRQKPFVYTLQHYNSRLNLTTKRKLNLQHDGNRLNYQFMVQLNDKLYAFSSYYNNNKDKECLLAQEIDPESLISGEAVTVAEVDNVNKEGFFSYELSEDRSLLLVAYTSLERNGTERSVDLTVLDEELNTLWNKRNCLQKSGRSFIVEQYRLDNEGNVFLLSTFFPDSRVQKRSGDPTYQYVLTALRKQGQEYMEYGIDLKNKFITDLQLKLKGGIAYGGGFYAEEGSFNVKGSYFFTIDTRTDEVISRSVKEFDPAFLEEQCYMEGKDNRQEDSQLRRYGFTLNDILLRDDGSAFLTGEQYYVSSGSSFSKKTKRVKSSFYYDFQDIIIVNVSPDGEIIRNEKVEKHQHTSDDAGIYSSYIPVLSGESLYFLFNTHPVRGPLAMGKARLSEMNIIRLSANGETELLRVPQLRQDMIFIPATAVQPEKGKIVVLAEGKRKNCFLRVSLSRMEVLSRR